MPLQNEPVSLRRVSLAKIEDCGREAVDEAARDEPVRKLWRSGAIKS